MHHWTIGGPITIGWPDFGYPDKTYTLLEFELLGKVFRTRVTDGRGQGGFLVVYDCPEATLERLAEEATRKLGFEVTLSHLRCSVEGTVLRSFDYEWYPTPEYAERPSLLARAIADLITSLEGEANG